MIDRTTEGRDDDRLKPRAVRLRANDTLDSVERDQAGNFCSDTGTE